MNTVYDTDISNSMKEYLEAIYELSKSNKSVRTTDIAQKLGISKPSVNKAVGALKAKGLLYICSLSMCDCPPFGIFKHCI